MSLHGTHVAILAEREYEDLELWYPLMRLREEGAEVTVIGPQANTYLSKHGYPVQATLAASAADPARYQALIVPGGWAPDYLRRDKAVVGLVKAVAGAGGVIGAICHGGSVLVSADVVRGRRMTSVTAIRDDLTNAGATWVDAEVVVDGNLVTSRRPDDLAAFLPAIIRALQGSGRRDLGTRVLIDGEVISLRLQPAAFEYMVEMLGRIPSAKGYSGEEFDASRHRPQVVLQDFASHADPKGSLEADPVQVTDVTPADGGYIAQGDQRLLQVLEDAGVPGLSAI